MMMVLNQSLQPSCCACCHNPRYAIIVHHASIAAYRSMRSGMSLSSLSRGFFPCSMAAKKSTDSLSLVSFVTRTAGVRPREVHDACQPPPNPRRAHKRRGDVLQIHVVVGVVDSERATVCAAGAVAEHFGYFWVTKQPSHVVAEPVDVRHLEEA